MYVQDEEARVQFEVELRQQLARQAAAHSDHLQEVLKIQEQELLQKYERQFNLKFIEERQAFQAEIAGWVARLKGIETAVESKPSFGALFLVSFCYLSLSRGGGEGTLMCCFY